MFFEKYGPLADAYVAENEQNVIAAIKRLVPVTQFISRRC